MQIETLRNFVALSKSHNFSETAKRFYISQSVLSKRISALEKEIGVTLFIRDNYSVRLTPEGTIFANRVSEALGSINLGLDEIRELQKGFDSILRIGFIYGAMHNLLPLACEKFAKVCPRTELKLYSLESDQAFAALEAKKLDLTLTLYYENYTPDIFERRKIFEDGCGVLVPHSHRLAKHSHVTIADLQGETLLAPNEQAYPFYSRFVHAAFDNCNMDITILYNLTDITMVLPYLATGRGIIFTNNHLLWYYGNAYTFVPFDNSDFNFSFDICAMWRKSYERQSLLKFLTCMEEAKKDLYADERLQSNFS